MEHMHYTWNMLYKAFEDELAVGFRLIMAVNNNTNLEYPQIYSLISINCPRF